MVMTILLAENVPDSFKVNAFSYLDKNFSEFQDKAGFF